MPTLDRSCVQLCSVATAGSRYNFQHYAACY